MSSWSLVISFQLWAIFFYLSNSSCRDERCDAKLYPNLLKIRENNKKDGEKLAQRGPKRECPFYSISIVLMGCAIYHVAQDYE